MLKILSNDCLLFLQVFWGLAHCGVDEQRDAPVRMATGVKPEAEWNDSGSTRERFQWLDCRCFVEGAAFVIA